MYQTSMLHSLRTIVILASSLIFVPNICFAAVHLGLSGAWANSHLGLETHTTQMGKATLSVDLGSYLRLGYSFAQILQHREGYEDNAADGADPSYVYFEQDVVQMVHSVDLFAILYAGSVFTPYIFAGGAMKYYKITYQRAGQNPKVNEDEEPSPNVGVGLSIAVTKSFSMKVSNTWSMGLSAVPGQKAKRERDSQLEVGVNYAID